MNQITSTMESIQEKNPWIPQHYLLDIAVGKYGEYKKIEIVHPHWVIITTESSQIDIKIHDNKVQFVVFPLKKTQKEDKKNEI